MLLQSHLTVQADVKEANQHVLQHARCAHQMLWLGGMCYIMGWKVLWLLFGSVCMHIECQSSSGEGIIACSTHNEHL